jgi:glycosyltransferase involved in cell wall biosynthesis
MRILHVYKDYFPVLGGIENHVRDLARGQVRAGHEVTVLVTHPAQTSREESDEGVRVLRVGRLLTLASTPLSPLLALELARLAPDVTHLHFPYPVGELAHLLFGRGRRTVITYHADIVRQAALLRLYGPLLRRVLARADALIATSEPYVRSSPWLAPHAGKTTVIPLGIDIDRFARADPARVAELRARFAPPSGALFLHVGRLRYYKGLGVALDAMPAVEGRLLVVGGGPEEAALRAQAARLALGDRVVFVGDVGDDDLVPWFHAADVFVSASIHRSEAFGISIIEALASGRPAISTELGTGTSWVNQHEVTGLVVPPNEPEALAAAMNALGRDPARRARLGAGGRARAEAEFRTETMIDRVLALYSRLLNG